MPGPLAGFSDNGWAVWGSTSNGTGTVGTAGNGIGAYGDSQYGDGVVGKCLGSNKNGVRGESLYGNGVYGNGRFGSGVYGNADSSSAGVYGYSRLGIGVQGQGPYAGLWGRATGSGGSGVTAYSEHGAGVNAEGNMGIFAYSPTNSYAGWFLGEVYVTGNLTKAGGGFRIDHPRDPANKYLNHSFVESSEMKTMYDGIVTLDENGEARVDLPEWFEAVNGDDGDFRYQLTAVGRAAPNLHVAEEIYENRFRIAGGEGGMKVCWQLTGSRKDPWAAAYPLEVEQEKPQEERGRYVHPHLYSAPQDQMINPPELPPDNGEVPSEPPQVPLIPETPPGTPPGFGAPGFGYPRAENTEELRGQIEELRRQIEELKRRG